VVLSGVQGCGVIYSPSPKLVLISMHRTKICPDFSPLMAVAFWFFGHVKIERPKSAVYPLDLFVIFLYRQKNGHPILQAQSIFHYFPIQQ